MEGVTISQAAGGQRAFFPGILQRDDELIFSAPERKTTNNGQPFQKEGFYSLQCRLGFQAQDRAS